jgi:hypothetical protein
MTLSINTKQGDMIKYPMPWSRSEVKLPAAVHEEEASFTSDCNKEAYDRRDEDRQDAVTEKLKKCGSQERTLSKSTPFLGDRSQERDAPG